MVFQEWFNEVLFCNFVFAWISSQLPEQKEGLLSVLGSRHILLKSKMSMLKHCYCPLAPGFLSKSQGKSKTSSWLYFCNIKTNNNWQEPSNDFHWRNCNTPFWWTMTFDERQPLMVDNHWWKTTLDGRWTSMFDGPQILLKDGLWLKMTFDGRQPLMRLNLRKKISLDGRQPQMVVNLKWKTNGRHRKLDNELWWKKTLDGRQH